MLTPSLIVFSGLPGTGKTTLAQALAKHLKAVYVRIDTIEQALLRAGLRVVTCEGYDVANAVAEENIARGNIVVVDCVNPIPETRDAWRNVAQRTSAKLIEIEVICSDKEEHKRRVEARKADITGHKMPTWQEVIDRDYRPWDTKALTIDTATLSKESAFNDLIDKVGPYLTA